MINAQKVKGNSDLAEIVREHGVVLEQRGDKLFGLCPFHKDEKPSFNIYEENTKWKCHGCGKGGDVINFVEYADGVSFIKAMETLKKKYHITESSPMKKSSSVSTKKESIPLSERMEGYELLEDSPAEEYLESRGIDNEEIISNYKVFYHPKWFGVAGAILFGIFDNNYDCVAYEGRCLDGDFELYYGGESKILDAGRRSKGLFYAKDAFSSDVIVIVKGPIDALSLAVCGVPAVAVCGVINCVPWLIEKCRDKVVWLAFESNGKGNRFMRSYASKFKEQGIDAKIINPPDGMDWNDALMDHGKKKLSEELKKALAL